MIVTIDGPAGSGKSTAAKGLADRLGFEFLDTGAMYRCVAWAVLQKQVDPADEAAVVDLSRQIQISFSDAQVLVNDEEVTGLIRTPEVTEVASVVAQYPGVREELVRLQRDAASGTNIVSEGRDQGTVVFPDAFCKFFLVADPEERARRRHEELQSEGKDITVDEILQQIYQRDQRDEQRDVAPLKAADDALEINTSAVTIDEVLDRLEQTVRERISSLSQ
ncbi:(d)CMP kinase [Gimesia maris]|jgi:cytidylate kinase|uniref:Cytidylate kinase n=1 Tax=Gimesia maris TaxID=122 RepID=A0A3D3R2N0_9PLAN|nr:(d)CMP kinase [Gimesia maris]MAC55150.1 cytidylate kinase [Gimesia sp.]QDT79354.1 Cytidylate kinase [Gimesia maris]HCO23009.1 (d)CMP kinase [Gimesia maris]|tara:strand:- start:120355 stop:121017 length:663 start_codon:yes stop_codon:yes gene_type:complete